MKNVFKRCLKLLTLFSSNNETLTTNFIKDNVAEYRELGDSAFKRSFAVSYTHLTLPTI